MSDDTTSGVHVEETSLFRKLSFPAPGTNRIRGMLEERGIYCLTYVPEEDRNVLRSCWKMSDDQDGYCYYDERFSGVPYANTTELRISSCTPEQAMDATMGLGTCTLEEVDIDSMSASEYMISRKWCFDAVYRCSCGCLFGYVAQHRPNHCPNCNRRVVDA